MTRWQKQGLDIYTRKDGSSRMHKENPYLFPSVPPLTKPDDANLSAAIRRMYDRWHPLGDRANDLFSNFKYSRVSGIGSEIGVSRRDPSSIINVDGEYYVWYTKRDTDDPPAGLEGQTLTRPAVDWDLADIWYATSINGFDWRERGVAVHRAPKGHYGDRSLSTPGILVYEQKYYLYFQCFTNQWEPHDCVSVGMAWAESPDGPWHRVDQPVIERGGAEAWDGCAIHDPHPLVYRDKIWVYYKGSPIDKSGQGFLRAQGVAISENPEGPFIKSGLNPVTNSGHETCLFPFRDGIAAIISLDGPEKNTIQFAPDGLNFSVKSHIILPPVAPGVFAHDMFAGNDDGRGITWGLCHIRVRNLQDPAKRNEIRCFIARFDCDLSIDISRPEFKGTNIRFSESVHFDLEAAMKLSSELKDQIVREQLDQKKPTIGT
tara:strand:+ start:169 stop:1461 length:1293 start_codon:yes stop_codon:yes gene_type:complete